MGLVDLEPLVSLTGLSVDVLGPGLALLSSYFLALPFAMLSSAAAKNAFSVAASGLIFVALFNVQGLVQLLALSGTCYFVSIRFRNSSRMPVFVLVLSMAVLAMNHLNSQFFQDELSPRFDQTVPMMVAVQKMATFAWSIHDGTKSDKKLSITQQSLKISTIPSILQYLGFIFFYPAFILGPSFHFNTYNDFVNNSGEFSLAAGTTVLPGRWVYFSKTLAIGLVCVVIHMIAVPIFMYDFGLTDAFLEYSFFERCGYLLTSAIVQQCQFFSAWKLAEGACILCGFGFNGADVKKAGAYKWDRCENVRIWEIELAENPRMFLSAWNVQTALWLRSAVYLRLAPEPLPDQTLREAHEAKAMASFATHATFLVSAFWHGFYPGFYLTFITLSFLVSANRISRKWIRPWFHNPESKLHSFLPVYHVVGWAVTCVGMNYATVGMQMKLFSSAMILWRRIYFSVHIALVAYILLDIGLGALSRPKKVVGASKPSEKTTKTE
ncbi:lysophospholipid acyltransferase [Chytriomyces hyalinus]|nr:lysophospholipid acyltransferase [Chytriomyces hyalinus]